LLLRSSAFSAGEKNTPLCPLTRGDSKNKSQTGRIWEAINTICSTNFRKGGEPELQAKLVLKYGGEIFKEVYFFLIQLSRETF